MAMEYNLYRKDHQQGGSKDWGIAIPPGSKEIHVRFCATNKTARLRVIQTQNATLESQKRIQKKVREGYRYIGKADLKSNRFQIIDPVIHHGLNLYYRSLAPVDLKVLKEAIEKVKLLPSIGVVEVDDVNWQVEVASNLFGQPIIWDFGSDDSGNLAGVLDLTEVGVVPILILMLIQESSSIRFADKSGEAVVVELKEDSIWFQQPDYPFVEVKEMARTLGLLLGPIDYSAIGSKLNNQAPAVWF
jgi:hypothetical protein